MREIYIVTAHIVDANGTLKHLGKLNCGGSV